MATVANFLKCVNTSAHKDKVTLLKDPVVVEYLLHPTITSQRLFNNKTDENAWGREKSFSINSNVKKNSCNWTTTFGETVVKEMYTLMDHSVYKPTTHWETKKHNGKKKRNFPDWETDKCILEVKTQTYHTSGTAGEKVLGTPVKYIGLPSHYNKPLHIVCLAGLEYIYKCDGLFEDEPCDQRKAILELWEKMDIHFIKMSDVMKDFINNNIVTDPLVADTILVADETILDQPCDRIPSCSDSKSTFVVLGFRV